MTAGFGRKLGEIAVLDIAGIRSIRWNLTFPGVG